METLIINKPDVKISKCPYCRTEAKLNSDEIESKTFICPNCKRENVIWELRDDYSQNIQTENKNAFWEFTGFVSAVLSFFLFPPAFGILGIICGFKCFQNGARFIGVFIMFLTVTLLILGLTMGTSA